MTFSESNGSDDISLFLRQLLHRSNSPPAPSPLSSAPSFPPRTSSPLPPALLHSAKQQQSFSFTSSPAPPGAVIIGGSGRSLDSYHQLPSRSMAFSSSDRVSPADESSGFASAGSSFSQRCLPAAGVGSSYSVSSVGAVESDSVTAGSVQMRSVENDAEDYDCDSEEGAEAGLEEAQAKQNSSRSSSKRSRAAEVHNLSEKRRRSRINEKMKALQNLIPNSNKTDKASMLDEAIEYLKQLQLQVQMLSMRNGLSLHPMCLPGVSGLLHPSQLSQLGINFNGWDGCLPSNSANAVPLGASEQCAATTTMTMRPLTVHNISSLINAEMPFSAVKSSSLSPPNQLASFPLQTSYRDVGGEDKIAYRQLVIDNAQPNGSGFETESTAKMPLSLSKLGPQPSDAREGGADQVRLLATGCPR